VEAVFFYQLSISHNLGADHTKQYVAIGIINMGITSPAITTPVERSLMAFSYSLIANVNKWHAMNIKAIPTTTPEDESHNRVSYFIQQFLIRIFGQINFNSFN
jgi:hypothetical protein